MSKTSNLLLYYCTVIALFMSVSGFLTSGGGDGLIFQFLFLPITLYFVFGVIRNLKSHTVDVNLNGRTTAMVVFSVIFLILLALAVKNIVQLKSPQPTQIPEKSEENTLIIKPEESQ